MIIGLDMGGTHVDAVLMDGGRVLCAVKNPLHGRDSFASVWSAVQQLLAGQNKAAVERIHLSTTVSTNAIAEGKTEPVGLFLQRGPGLPLDFADCGEFRFFFSGYTDHRGAIVKNLDFREIEAGLSVLKDRGVAHCAVVSKFSTRNPSAELAVSNHIQKDVSFVTMGHSLSGKLHFPRRVRTAYLNAAVYGTFKAFAENVRQALAFEGIGAPLYVLKADGGTFSLERAEEMPVETILSGPAASCMGASAMLSTEEDAILLDIGGTTTDIFFLAGGTPLFEPWGIQIGPYKTLVRAIFSASVGLGGDSRVHFQDGEFHIGPTREGPPVVYSGKAATPTDAMVVLGLIRHENEAKAWECMAELGRLRQTTAEETAREILRNFGNGIRSAVSRLLNEINARPVYTIRELLQGKSIQPRHIQVIGGPAKALAPVLESIFALPCRVPKHYAIANAVGAALAKTTAEIHLFADTSEGVLSVAELAVRQSVPKNYALAEAREQALSLLRQHAVALGADFATLTAEITEESAFPMVRGFYRSGKNIRITAQVQPGLSVPWEEENDAGEE